LTSSARVELGFKMARKKMAKTSSEENARPPPPSALRLRRLLSRGIKGATVSAPFGGLVHLL